MKDFWNFRKPYFTNKGVCNNEKIIIFKKEEVQKKIQITKQIIEESVYYL